MGLFCDDRTGVDHLGMVVRDALDFSGRAHFLDSSTSQRPVDLQTLDEGGRSNELHLGDFVGESFVGFSVEENLVGDLIANLSLGPLLLLRLTTSHSCGSLLLLGLLLRLGRHDSAG